MPHIGADRRKERAIGVALERERVEGCQAPILSFGIVDIRGRTNGGSRGQEILRTPGFGAVRVQADGEISVQSNPHARFLSGARDEG
jgi:hypothetical protein